MWRARTAGIGLKVGIASSSLLLLGVDVVVAQCFGGRCVQQRPVFQQLRVFQPQFRAPATIFQQRQTFQQFRPQYVPQPRPQYAPRASYSYRPPPVRPVWQAYQRPVASVVRTQPIFRQNQIARQVPPQRVVATSPAFRPVASITERFRQKPTAAVTALRPLALKPLIQKPVIGSLSAATLNPLMRTRPTPLPTTALVLTRPTGTAPKTTLSPSATLSRLQLQPLTVSKPVAKTGGSQSLQTLAQRQNALRVGAGQTNKQPLGSDLQCRALRTSLACPAPIARTTGSVQKPSPQLASSTTSLAGQGSVLKLDPGGQLPAGLQPIGNTLKSVNTVRGSTTSEASLLRLPTSGIDLHTKPSVSISLQEQNKLRDRLDADKSVRGELLRTRYDWDALQLASVSYNGKLKPGDAVFKENLNWRVDSVVKDERTGYHAYVFHNKVENRVVLAVQGSSSPLSVFSPIPKISGDAQRDWGQNFDAIVLGAITPQMQQTQMVLAQMKTKFGSTAAIDCVGHSQGGGNCAYATSRTLGTRGVALEPTSPGVNQSLVNQGHVFSYVAPGDAAKVGNKLFDRGYTGRVTDIVRQHKTINEQIVPNIPAAMTNSTPAMLGYVVPKHEVCITMCGGWFRQHSVDTAIDGIGKQYGLQRYTVLQ